MTPFVHIAMIGWVPVVVALFAMLPPRRAVLIGFIGGWLFLPMAAYQLPGIPDYTKDAACSIAVLAGVLLFDRKALASLRLRLIDVPMIAFCLCPFVTKILIGLGLMGGLSIVIKRLLVWGIPYMIGRAYFRNLRGLRELAIAVFIGGLVYLPLVWYEIRMSPQLHKIIYGYLQHRFVHVLRYGGYRPRVFMQSGLMLAFWMAAVTTVGVWLWRSKSLTRLWRMPMGLLVWVLIVTTVLCKSGNGVVLMGVGIALFFATKLLRSPVPLLLMALAAPAYITLRATGLWDGGELVASFSFDDDRSGNLAARMGQEEVYTDQAWKRPFFGWGGGGFIPRDADGKRLVSGNDSFWIITLGKYGLVSLISIFGVFLLVPLVLIFRIPVWQWLSPAAAPAAAMAMVIALFAIDCLFNAMLSPVYVLAMGGMCGIEKFAVSHQPVAGRDRSLATDGPELAGAGGRLR